MAVENERQEEGKGTANLRSKWLKENGQKVNFDALCLENGEELLGLDWRRSQQERGGEQMAMMNRRLDMDSVLMLPRARNIFTVHYIRKKNPFIA